MVINVNFALFVVLTKFVHGNVSHSSTINKELKSIRLWENSNEYKLTTETNSNTSD